MKPNNINIYLKCFGCDIENVGIIETDIFNESGMCVGRNQVALCNVCYESIDKGIHKIVRNTPYSHSWVLK